MSQVVLAGSEAQRRGLIAARLADKGVNVSQAADGAEALRLLQDHPGTTLLLCDLPSAKDDDLVTAALALRPELKLLIMTAHAGDRPPPAALRAREVRTLVKPLDPERLCELVVEMMARP